MAWSIKSSRARIESANEELQEITVKKFTKASSLYGIPLTTAYRVQAAHVYVEIPNALDMLSSTATEGAQSHRRLLRFLHIYQRIARVVLAQTSAIKVDHQNQRLHFIMHNTDDRAAVLEAVAVASALRDVLLNANELHAELEDATVTVGVDVGEALAVSNGTRGDREPLFLGGPANLAAKMTASKKSGVFLTDHAREQVSDEWAVADAQATPLSQTQLDYCSSESGLNLNVDKLLERWQADLSATPLAEFQFSRATPPLKYLDFDQLSPKNTKRMEMGTVIADVDGFTRFVAEHASDDDAPLLVRALHVIRKEMRDVLNDFGGIKLRYVGDALFGHLAEGTSMTTDVEESVTTLVGCAGALRDAFGVIQEVIPETSELGLQIGLEVGPVSLTRLGVKGARDRCAIGLSVLNAETWQADCGGTETALGDEARRNASPGVSELFEDGPIVADLTYNKVMAAVGASKPSARQNPPGSESSFLFPRAHTES